MYFSGADMCCAVSSQSVAGATEGTAQKAGTSSHEKRKKIENKGT